MFVWIFHGVTSSATIKRHKCSLLFSCYLFRFVVLSDICGLITVLKMGEFPIIKLICIIY